VTKDELIQCAFNKAWRNECEGSCTNDEGVEEHRGECKVVHVSYPNERKNDAWHFSYCDEAIAEDKRRGFTVEILNVAEIVHD
jgi:hypothetical protein